MSYSELAFKALLIKANSKFDSAQANFLAGRMDSCVSDLYYSAFQYVCALMVKTGKSTSKHTQVRSFVNKNLSLQGLMSIELARMYNKLMDMRSDADYSAEVTFTFDEVEHILDQVRSFNTQILMLIEQ